MLLIHRKLRLRRTHYYVFIVLSILIYGLVQIENNHRIAKYGMTSILSNPSYNGGAREINIFEHRGISLLDSMRPPRKSNFLEASLLSRDQTNFIPKLTTEIAVAGQHKMSAELKDDYRGVSSASVEMTKILTTTANMTRPSTTKLTSTTTTTVIPHRRYMVDITDDSYYGPFIKTVMESRLRCHDASSYDAVMAVHTAPGNVDKRQAFRWMYTDHNKTYPHKIKLVFFIGLVKNLTLQSQLMIEQIKFGDLVQGSYIDAYVNLTFKAIFSYKWLSENCLGLRLLLRLDDDVFMQTQQFFRDWSALVGTRTNTIMCDTESNDRVRRNGKWSVKRSEMAEDKYRFQHCLGYFVALTPDLVPKMFAVARKTRFFWIDDIFMYGIIAKKVGVRFLKINRQMPRWKEDKFVTCLKDHGNRCRLLTHITKPDKFKYLYSLTQNHTEHIQSS